MRNSSRKARPIRHAGVEPALEQVAAFLLAEVDHGRVALTDLPDRGGQAVIGFGDGDEYGDGGVSVAPAASNHG